MADITHYFHRRRLWNIILVIVAWLIFVQVVFWTVTKDMSAWQYLPGGADTTSLNVFIKGDTYHYTRRRNNSSVLTAPPGTVRSEIPRQQLIPSSVCISIVHSRGEELEVDKRCAFMVVVAHALDDRLVKTERLSLFEQEDQSSFSVLAEFLQTASDYDAATCIQPSTETRESTSKVNNSSWCRFTRREWSLIIRNTGQWRELTDHRSNSSSTSKYIFQECNIVQGPFVIRANVFENLGGWKGKYGKASILDFFLRSKGKLRIAKLTNCVWLKGITKVDRGKHLGSKVFEEYINFGNEHRILRIIKEDGIEWTRCIANHILCPEKPYMPPKALPEAALPICCSVVVYNLLTHFVQVVDKLGIEYRLLYGTLLGAVRSNAIIPWTHDADVAIDRAAYDAPSTFPTLQKLLGDEYYIGNSYMDIPRMHAMVPPRLDLDTRTFFDGPDDLSGDAFFSSQIQDAVQGMLPISAYWRAQTYLDVYYTFDVWLNGSATVTINNRTFMTVKAFKYELTNWYGENYLSPVLRGSWFGLSDSGTV